MTTQQIPPPGPDRDHALAEALGGTYLPETSRVCILQPEGGFVIFSKPSTDDHSALNLVLWLSTREPEKTRWGFRITLPPIGKVHAEVWLPGSVLGNHEGRDGSSVAPSLADAVTEAMLRALETK